MLVAVRPEDLGAKWPCVPKPITTRPGRLAYLSHRGQQAFGGNAADTRAVCAL